MDLPVVSPVIAEMFEAAARYERGPKRSYLGMSTIGKRCERALWYSFRGFTPAEIDGRTKMIFSIGDCVEEEIIKWLNMAGIKVRERQRTFEDINGLFRGHWDGMLSGLTSQDHVLEVKSASANRFKAFQDNGIEKMSPEYFAQVQCYMGYSGLQRALFVVMNKNDCSLYSERVHFSSPFFKDMKAKALRIITATVVPEKTDGDCDFCGFKQLCNDGAHVQKYKTCGTCTFCRIKPDATIVCEDRDCQIKNWGLSCDHWLYLFDIDQVPF